MDIPFGAWLPELDTEDPREFMYQLPQTPSYSELVDSFSSPNFKSYPNLVTRDHSVSEDLEKQESHKATTTSSFAPIVGGSSSSNFTISFGDFTSPCTALNQTQLNGGYKMEDNGAIKRGVSRKRRNRRQAQDHILAERKRREMITQRFNSLSNVIPEIKKMDKATVLEDACKHIKHLQNRVKELEQTSIDVGNIIQESTTSMRKSKFHDAHELDTSSFDPCNAVSNPGIKVRIVGSNVLVRIYSQRNSPLALKALAEMERLHFTIMCNSVLPISDTAALITIIAQMNEEFVVTATDLVQCLRLSLLKYR